jgi:hypothetical protein
MSGSTKLMVNVKMCAIFQETSAAVKDSCGCRCDTNFYKGPCDECGEEGQPSGMKMWTTKEKMNLGKGQQ